MNKRLLLHIGTGKTGTSSIQKALKRMQHKNIVYPLINDTGNQNIDTLFKSYSQAGRGIKSKFDEAEFIQFKEKMKKQLSDSFEEAENFIISSEYLFDCKTDQVKNLFDYFRTHGFSEIKIVVYLRSPASYYLSAIQQRLKASYIYLSPNDFKIKLIGNLKRWSNIFGFEHLIVREFNPKMLDDGNVVTDFENIVNGHFNQSITLEKIVANESISAEGMQILQDYRRKFHPYQDNLFFNDSNKLVAHLLSLYKGGLGSKPKLKKHVENQIMFNHKNEIEYIQKTHQLFLSTEIDESTKFNSDKDDTNKHLDAILENDLSPVAVNEHYLNMLGYLMDK